MSQKPTNEKCIKDVFIFLEIFVIPIDGSFIILNGVHKSKTVTISNIDKDL